MKFTDPSSYWKEKAKEEASKAKYLQSQLDAALHANYDYKNEVEKLKNYIKKLEQEKA